MEKNIGRIWLALLVLALAVVVFFAGDSTEADRDEGRRGAVSDRADSVGNPVYRGPIRRTLARSSHQGMAPGRKISSPRGGAIGRRGCQGGSRKGTGRVQSWHAEASASRRLDAGNFGVAVGRPIAWSDLRIWRCGRVVASASGVPVHRYHRDGRADRRRIGDNPRADGAGRRFPEKEPNARKPILKAATFGQRRERRPG